LEHNGAKLYQPWYGGGIELHSIQRALELHESLDYLPDNWLPIAYVIDQGYVIIDIKAKSHYLIFLGSFIVSEAKQLKYILVNG
jgi:hypothetical protein